MRVPTGLTRANLAPLTRLHVTGGTEHAKRSLAGGPLRRSLVDDHRHWALSPLTDIPPMQGPSMDTIRPSNTRKFTQSSSFSGNLHLHATIRLHYLGLRH